MALYNMNGKVYYIQNLLDMQPCYVGQTIQTLEQRFANHVHDVNSPIHTLVQQYGKDNFEIKLIMDNITDKQELNRIEQECIIEFSMVYDLYNSAVYTQYYNTYYLPLINDSLKQDSLVQDSLKQDSLKQDSLTSISEEDYFSKPVVVKCIETQEVFSSINQVAKKYTVDRNTIIRAVMYGYAITTDQNRVLHFFNVTNPQYISRIQTVNYYIYVIKQLINDQWTPIYVQHTKYTIKNQIKMHKANINSPIYTVLNQYPLKNFRIVKRQDNIKSLKEAKQLEQEAIEQLSQQYTIYNKIEKSSEQEIQPSIYTRMVTWKQLREDPYFKGHEALYLCMEDNILLLSLQSIAMQYNKTQAKVKQAIADNTPLKYNGQEKHIIKLNIQSYTKNLFTDGNYQDIQQQHIMKTLNKTATINNKNDSINTTDTNINTDIDTNANAEVIIRQKHPYIMGNFQEDLNINDYDVNIYNTDTSLWIKIPGSKQALMITDATVIFAMQYYIYRVEYKKNIPAKYFANYLPYNDMLASLQNHNRAGISQLFKENTSELKIVIIQDNIFFKPEIDDLKLVATGKQKRTAPKFKAMPVRCITTGEEFPSLWEAKEHYGYKTEDAIWKVCRGINPCTFDKDKKQLTWEFINPDDQQQKWKRKDKYNVVAILLFKRPLFVTVTSFSSKKDILTYYRYHHEKMKEVIANNNWRYLSIRTYAKDLAETEAKALAVNKRQELINAGYQLIEL